MWCRQVLALGVLSVLPLGVAAETECGSASTTIYSPDHRANNNPYSSLGELQDDFESGPIGSVDDWKLVKEDSQFGEMRLDYGRENDYGSMNYNTTDTILVTKCDATETDDRTAVYDESAWGGSCSCEDDPSGCSEKGGEVGNADMDGRLGFDETGCVDGCSVQTADGVGIDMNSNGEEVLTQVEYTGQSCSAGDSEGVPEPDKDCITDADGNEACIEAQDEGCGTFNGERVCPEELPDEATCRFLGDGEYVCATSGDDAPVPDEEDWPEDSDGNKEVPQLDVTADLIGPDGTEANVGEGSYGESDSLGDSGDADSGGDGDGDGEGEGVCATDPAICSNLEDMVDGLGESNSELSDVNQGLDDANESLDDANDSLGEMTDDSVPGSDQNEADGPLPGDAVEENALPDSPVHEDSGLGSDASCPEPETVDLSFLGAGTKEISYQPFCDFAATIRPLVLAVFGGLSGLLAFRKLA